MDKHLSSFAIRKDGQYFKAHLQSVPKGCASRNKIIKQNMKKQAMN